MWYIILGVVMLATCAAFLFVSARVAKFGFMQRLARGNDKLCKSLSAGFVLLVWVILWQTLNFMNAVVCLVHLAVIWGVCDWVFAMVQRFRKKPFKRYYAGAIAIILTIISLLWSWYLNHHVAVTRYQVVTDKNVEDLRIVMFADSHIGTTFSGEELAKHVQKMQEENPDIVLIVGDFVDNDTKKADMITAAKSLGTLETKYGVYLVWGNHDISHHGMVRRGYNAAEMVAELEKNNVKILADEVVLIKNSFYLVGRKDAYESFKGRDRKTMEELVVPLDKSKFMIVADHQPNDYKNQKAAEVDLVLSGHTHGGQLWPLTKIGEWIGANDKTYGLERRGKTDFVVTSGISDWTLKFKSGTKSEFVVIDIKSKS